MYLSDSSRGALLQCVIVRTALAMHADERTAWFARTRPLPDGADSFVCTRTCFGCGACFGTALSFLHSFLAAFFRFAYQQQDKAEVNF